MAVKKDCKPQKRGNKYDNPKEWTDWVLHGSFKFVENVMKENNQAGIPSNTKKLDKTLPVHKIKGDGIKQLQEPEIGSDFRIMWIGHATLLVQFDGITVLTDPVFADRCSPSQLFGPKRYRPVPCQIKDLPDIDAVIISHNHYDHLEYDAVVQINRKHGDKVRWFVPEGLKKWFTDSGCSNIAEMTWWEEATLNNHDTKFICVPTQHCSQRTPFDAMESLWCGWVIKSPTKTFYYTGDTGYCPVFKTIGEKYGPMDLSAIPIGCYEPREDNKAQHINPEEAVKIHTDVHSQRSVGTKWGTFDGLGSHEYYLEPRELLKEALKENGLTDEDFFTVKHGEIKTVPVPKPLSNPGLEDCQVSVQSKSSQGAVQLKGCQDTVQLKSCQDTDQSKGCQGAVQLKRCHDAVQLQGCQVVVEYKGCQVAVETEELPNVARPDPL